MKVSVALCTYNGEKYIEQQLNSILNQNYPVEEIQIGDDGSSDKTIDIIDSCPVSYTHLLLVLISIIPTVSSNSTFLFSL